MNNETSVSIKFSNSVTGEKKLEKYAETLSKINSILGAIDTGKAKGIENSLKEPTKDADKLEKGLSTAFNTAKITAFIASINKLTKTISGYTKKSAEYLENMNLLDVAFNSNTNEAKQFVNTLSEMYGLDESWGYKTVGIFKQLANAMGLADEVGTKMSKTLTQLAIDTSSLYNINVEDTVSILQSALAGQTKPARRLGADITQSTLQLTMDTAGIDRGVESLTYAEKRLVIVASLLNQTQKSFGDWGRTIDSVANQMRIFQQQAERLTRAIGNVFLKALKVVLPYLNAFMMVLTEIISWFAVLVGYEEEEYDFFGGTNESVIELSDGLASASENAKKLKSGLRGFDKLNNITTPTSTSASGGGAGSIDPEILDLFNKASNSYMDALENTKNKATEIRDKIMEWLGFTKMVDKATGDVSFKFDHITGGTVLGALVVGGVIYSGVSKLLKMLTKIGLLDFSGIKTLGSSLSGLATITGLSGAFDDIAVAISGWATGAWSFSEALTLVAPALGTIALIAGGVLVAIAGLKLAFDGIKAIFEGETFQGITDTIAGIALVVTGVALAFGAWPVAIVSAIVAVTALFADAGESWKQFTESIKVSIDEAVKEIEHILTALWDEFIEPIIEKVKTIITDLWESTLQPMAEKIGKLILGLIELILVLWNNVLEPVIEWVIDVFAPIFEWAFSLIFDVIHTEVKLIGGLINGLLDILNGVIDFLVGVFTGNWKRALDGIVLILKGVANLVISIIEAVANLGIDIINTFIKAIWNGIKSLVNVVLGAVEAIADVLGFDIDITLKGKAPQIPKITIPRLKTGLDFVPNDYFPAYLDYGERVLTKEQNADYNKGIINGQPANNNRPINATFVIKVGDKDIAKQVINDLQDMAKDNGKPITIGG